MRSEKNFDEGKGEILESKIFMVAGYGFVVKRSV